MNNGLFLPMEVIKLIIKITSSELPINLENVASILISVGVIVNFSRATPEHLNLFPLFIISDQGLNVRIFNFWFIWKFIPWDRRS